MCTLQIFNSNESRIYNISSENIDIDSNNLFKKYKKLE